ncbi:MAG: hypothetical protein ACR2G7_10620 [Acidimicrobiales bacterium]
MRFHAIYTVLNEADLFAASVASIYDHVDGITVISGYDRDWKGAPHIPEGVVDRVLSREVDPQRKIELIVAAESNEARSRNRAMDFASPRRRSAHVLRQHDGDLPLPEVDYFWIVDADEIYDSADAVRLKAHVAEGRRAFYQVAAVTYFKTWDYRLEGHEEWFTAFVRADRRCGDRRNPYPNLVSRLVYRLPVGRATWSRTLGLERIPPEVGVFHHGSYVGPRERIAAKVRGFSHSDQVPGLWLEQVWDGWTPETTNFHPTVPEAFPKVSRVARNQLPSEITGHDWPAGYLEASHADEKVGEM